MKSFCDIKWDVFVPYLFYSGSVMLLTNQIPLNNFNFTRLNSEITKKGEGAIVAGYAVMRTLTLFDTRFRLARALHDILNNAGVIGDTRKGKARTNHFVKKGSFELTWEDFSLLEPKHIRRSNRKGQKATWRGTIDMDSGAPVIQVIVQNSTRPAFVIRMQGTTIKIKYGYSRKLIKAISKNPFGNFSKLSQTGKNVFHDIYGDFSIFFLHENDLLSKKCFSDKLFAFEKLEHKHCLFKSNEPSVPKSVDDIVKILKSVDSFDLFGKRNKFCRPYQTTTVRIWGLAGGIGAW
ncbi:uncharacterized protein LOC128547070 [Mercenaria mercenaria]|uniref:uncharacterized protein LOC128547070 n=1 Tax=Mercenaria mercenaria TaxID=6596 RepID=UPI00234EA7AF|nr:uncharacterized protein LOC128547070 [Mercenaria mercenaria]